MTKSLVDDNRDGIGKIYGADFLAHRDADALIRMSAQKLFGQAAGFRSKDKDVTALILDHAIAKLAFGGAGKDPFMGEKVIDIFNAIMDLHIELVPIIQSGAFQGFIIEQKTTGRNQMQS